MEYIFTKRQLSLLEGTSDTSVKVGNGGNDSINSVGSQVSDAMRKFPAQKQFTVNSNDFNGANSSSNRVNINIPIKKGENPSKALNKTLSGTDPVSKLNNNSYKKGDADVTFIETNEGVRFTKKELNEFLRSI